MPRVAGDLEPPKNWQHVVGELAANETVRILGRPFSLKINSRFVRGTTVVALTTHRFIVGAIKDSMFGGPKVLARVSIPLAEVGESIGTYARPHGTGALMFGIDGETNFGLFDAYFDTLQEQEEVFHLLEGAIALRAWE